MQYSNDKNAIFELLIEDLVVSEWTLHVPDPKPFELGSGYSRPIFGIAANRLKVHSADIKKR